MTSSNMHQLWLEDADLFKVDRARLDQIELALSDTDFEGIAVRAPAHVALSQGFLPLVLAWQQSGLRAWEVIDVSHMALLVTDLSTGQTKAVAPLESPKGVEMGGYDPDQRPPKPTGASAAAKVTQAAVYDLRTLVGLEWTDQTLAIAAVSWDWASQPVTVELGHGSAAQETGARHITPPPQPDGLPRYGPGPQGADLSLEIGVSKEFGTVAQGVFSLPFTSALSHSTLGANVPVTFALFQRGEPIPWLFHWVLPAYGEPAEGALLTSGFSIGLSDILPSGLPSGEYVGYVLVDGRISPPAILRM